MRIEKQGDHWIVCGHIFPLEKLAVGQRWQSSSGSVVEIQSIMSGDVTYAGDAQEAHTKDHFNFQCKYCLIADGIVLQEALQ